eukprot:NODE_1573_length_1487_cov_33.472184_g1419_i0.p1 GENE.NODE_1573_length_1487_cov_33.472184_g1419_i0~~NODE_1573_length_1487_cov_33.472184_g1419_i0.p1  ORF type:complete len:381 (+),score=57.46 NODE_1573_length_1487_cov_33.472184_g1419_i0:151-1293(+)
MSGISCPAVKRKAAGQQILQVLKKGRVAKSSGDSIDVQRSVVRSMRAESGLTFASALAEVRRASTTSVSKGETTTTSTTSISNTTGAAELISNRSIASPTPVAQPTLRSNRTHKALALLDKLSAMKRMLPPPASRVSTPGTPLSPVSPPSTDAILEKADSIDEAARSYVESDANEVAAQAPAAVVATAAAATADQAVARPARTFSRRRPSPPKPPISLDELQNDLSIPEVQSEGEEELSDDPEAEERREISRLSEIMRMRYETSLSQLEEMDSVDSANSLFPMLNGESSQPSFQSQLQRKSQKRLSFHAQAKLFPDEFRPEKMEQLRKQNSSCNVQCSAVVFGSDASMPSEDFKPGWQNSLSSPSTGTQSVSLVRVLSEN